MSKLMYGTYTFQHTPTVRISRAPLQDTTLPQAHRVTWTVEGMLEGVDTAALKALRDALVAAMVNGKTMSLFDGSDNIIEELAHPGSLRGVMIARGVEFPNIDGAEYATILSYRIELYADYATADAPAADAFGSYTITTAVDRDGTQTLSLQGRFTGPGASAYIDTLLAGYAAGYIMLRKSKGVDTINSLAEVQADFVDIAASPEIYSFEETIELTAAFTRRVIHELLGGGPAAMQLTTLAPAFVVQQGSAVGRTGYPPGGSDLYPELTKWEPTVISKRSPLKAADGKFTDYGISWRIVSVAPSGATLRNPHNPP